MMYLHRSFIDVNDRFLQKPFLQMVDEGIQLLFRSHDNPVDHHRPGKRQAHALPFGFLSIQGHRIPILLHHDVGNCRRRSNGMRNDWLRELWLYDDRRISLLTIPAFIALTIVIDDFYPGGGGNGFRTG